MRETSKIAFHWIVKLLRKQKIPFRVSGGLAARAYGAKRPLADIDLDVPDAALYKLAHLVKKFKPLGPKHYIDSEWDVNYVEFYYKQQEISLIGSDSQKIFNKNTTKWECFKIRLPENNKKLISGLIVPVIPKNDLISYKSKIRRKVDLIDVTFLTRP